MFWEINPPTKDDIARARVLRERQMLQDAYRGFDYRKRKFVVCVACGSRRGADGEPMWARWSWMGRAYCDACVPKRVQPRERHEPLMTDVTWGVCSYCKGRWLRGRERAKASYCSEECYEAAKALREREGRYRGPLLSSSSDASL